MNKKEILKKLNKIAKPINLVAWQNRIKKYNTMKKANVIIEPENLKIIVRGKGFSFKEWNDFRIMVNGVLTLDQCNAMIYEENPKFQFSVDENKLKKLGLIK